MSKECLNNYHEYTYTQLYDAYVRYVKCNVAQDKIVDCRYFKKSFSGDFHIHHIKPRKLYPELLKDYHNLLVCTPKQHTNLHYLYWKMSDNCYMEYAFKKMLEENYNMSVEEYEQNVFPVLQNTIKRHMSEKMKENKLTDEEVERRYQAVIQDSLNAKKRKILKKLCNIGYRDLSTVLPESVIEQLKKRFEEENWI